VSRTGIPLLYLAALTLALSATPQAQDALLRLDPANIGISKMIPVVGDRVTLLVPVVNPGEQALKGSFRLEASAARDGGKPVEFAAQEVATELGPGEARDIELAWQPKQTGFYTLTFELSGAGAQAERVSFGPVAVVAHNLYFAWFGAPKEFRWCNVPTTVKGEEAAAWWLRRGAIPCAWKGAVCYKEWPLGKLVEHYGGSRRIAIDEIGGPGEDTDKFMAALRELKKAEPDRFTAVWFMGAHEYWRDVTDVVDLFIPEVYLNYRGNHLGTFDSYIERTRAAGVMDRTVFGLGINIVKDEKTREPRVTPTKEDVLRQIRYLRRVTPDMPGVGFFTATSAAPGVAEYADELCGEYFVKPVATLVGNRVEIVPGSPARARVTVGNFGGMTARKVRVRLTQRRSDGTAAVDRSAEIETLNAGGRRQVEAPLAPAPGISLVTAEIAPSPQYTLLDARAEEPFCPRTSRPAALRDAVALVYLPPWGEGERTDVPVSWTLNQAPEVVRVVEVDLAERVRSEAPALTLGQGGKSVVRWVAQGPTRGGEQRYFAVLPGRPEGSGAAALPCEEADGRLTIRSPFYTAELDPGADEIVALTPAGSERNLLKAPWSLHCPGHEGFGKPEVVRSPGWVAVTVPYDSALASGESRYVFSALTAAIEVSHSLRPKAPIEVDGARDGCNLEQRGGSYALQPGVGGVVSRGLLQDSGDYRDLYFGYLAAGPSERNAGLAGWLDFSWDAQSNAGLGVAIAERWRDATYKSYDVTRLYDASDWIEVSYVWGTNARIEREQTSRVFLVPHGHLDMQQTAVPPARAVWETVHEPAREVAG
jgi:hypothetical protein